MVRAVILSVCAIAGGMNASAYSGERVVVSGAGFRPGTTVTFGSTPRVCVRADGDGITVTTPSRGAGTEDIVVTNPSGGQVRVAGFEFLDFQVTNMEPAAGMPGWVVNLHGAGFRLGARVRFGGVPATIHSIDSRRIRLTAPRLPPGVHAVEVINSDGQSVGRPAGFEYLPVTISLSQSAARPGGVVRVSWDCAACQFNPDFNIGDMLVMSRSGDGDSVWQWGVQIFDTAGTIDVTAPSVAGVYEFRYLLKETIRYATVPFTVAGDR